MKNEVIVMLKKWNVVQNTAALSKTVAEISKKYSLSPVVSTILVNRGHNIDSIPSFTNCDTQLEDPFVLKDMQKAVDRINQALNNSERIAIYGDYDCDGVTSTVLLYSYLLSIGCDVCYYIPNRFDEGYGMNTDSIAQLSNDGINLIITVDNGISAVAESKFISELGMDLIITDHHTPPDVLPNAVAIVNPHQADCKSTFKPLAGVGVAFKLITALEGGDYDMSLEYFADLVAVGTVADIVPLLGENRILVARGLQLLANRSNVGINALADIAKISGTFDAKTLAYMIAPRINASGRMGDSTLSVNLLLEEDPEQAQIYATQINELNAKRQVAEKAVLADILHIIEQNPKILYRHALVFSGSNWHAGVIGIVATRLVEMFGKPVFIMCEEDGVLAGSARSFKGVSVHSALASCSEYLIGFGGHTMAGGFRLSKENLPQIIKGIEEYLLVTHKLMPYPSIEADMVITPAMLKIPYIEELKLLEPFGHENNTPQFILQNAKILSITKLSNDAHLKLTVPVAQEKGPLDVLFFGCSSARFLYKEGDTVDILCTIEINTYNDVQSLVAKARDIRLSDIPQDKIIAGKLYYEKLKRKEKIDKSLLIKTAPTKKECGAVYKYLQGFVSTSIHLDDIYLPLAHTTINYCKFRVILDIFAELNLLDISSTQSGFVIVKSEQKTMLENSKIFTYFENIQK